MKKALPMPVILGVVALAAVVAGFFLYRGVSGPPELEAPKVEKTIPRYVFEKLPPAQQEKMRSEGYTVSDAAPTAVTPPGGAPSTPGAPGSK